MESKRLTRNSFAAKKFIFSWRSFEKISPLLPCLFVLEFNRTPVPWEATFMIAKNCLSNWLLATSGLILSNLLGVAKVAIAQVVPDETLPTKERTQVLGDRNFQIDERVTRGSNLFHSFSQFSVPTSGEAYFNNAANIQNIFSRVTGGSISNIDGLIRANARANLFLINPNGIIFGANARLNIGGSFLASTANSINFADGFKFSATNSQTEPLLTISVPIGLQFGQNPASIALRFKALSYLADECGEDVARGLLTEPSFTIHLTMSVLLCLTVISYQLLAVYCSLFTGLITRFVLTII
jgi:filamentous hemagglutinin family protein